MRNLGLVLIVLGIAMMLFTGFNIVTKKKVVDLGPLEINSKEKTPVSWSPILGVVFLVGGGAMFLMSKKR